MTHHVFVVSEWLAKEGKDRELWERAKQVMHLTSREKGCVRAHATRQISHPGSPGKSPYKIILLQEYVDLKAFDVHCKAEYVVDFFKTYVEDPRSSIVEAWTCRLLSEEVPS